MNRLARSCHPRWPADQRARNILVSQQLIFFCRSGVGNGGGKTFGGGHFDLRVCPRRSTLSGTYKRRHAVNSHKSLDK